MGEVTPIAPPRLVTAEEVAEYLAIPKSSVLRMARHNVLPKVMVGATGRLVRFRMEDIVKWVNDQAKKRGEKAS